MKALGGRSARVRAGYRTRPVAAAVTPAVRQLTGRDPIPFEQFACDHADKLR